MNKILLSECDNRDRQIRILITSPNQYSGHETSGEFKDCLLVYDDMLENKKKIFAHFVLAVDMKELLFIIYLSVILSYLY